MPASEIETILFDAYGTLFDITGEDWASPEVVQTMRNKQLQYSWMTTLMGQWREFTEITAAAIGYAIEAHGAVADPKEVLGAQLAIRTFPEVREALERLGRGRRLGILSNGTPDSLRALVENAGLADRFEWLLSSSEVRVFKPSPAVYQLALDRTRTDREKLLFVSSNGWDAAGAAGFGLRVAWVNRTGAPRERLGGPPEIEVNDLNRLAASLE